RRLLVVHLSNEPGDQLPRVGIDPRVRGEGTIPHAVVTEQLRLGAWSSGRTRRRGWRDYGEAEREDGRHAEAAGEARFAVPGRAHLKEFRRRRPDLPSDTVPGGSTSLLAG